MAVMSIQEWLKKFYTVDLPEEIREHDVIAKFETPAEVRDLCDFFPYKDELSKLDEVERIKALGLHLQHISQNSRCSYVLKAWYYVGCTWLLKSKNERVFAEVKPKKNVNFLSLISAIWRYPDIKYQFLSSREKVFWFDLKEPPILINRAKKSKDLVIFSLLSFINVLDSIVRKGLKKDYVNKIQNLNSTVKGKILTKESLQRNFLKGSITNIYCKFHTLSTDTVENQIIKYTLRSIVKNLLDNKIDTLKEIEEKILYFLSYFRNVSSIRVNRTTFMRVKYSRFYPEYREAIQLAKLILENLGFNFGKDQHPEKKIKVTPYVINMPKLYELYVWQWLLQNHKHKIKKIWYQKEFRFKDIDSSLKPDFIIKFNDGKIVIADAKYKFYNKFSDIKRDLQQISLYSRIKDLKKIAGELNTEPEIWLICPYIPKNLTRIENIFSNISINLCSLPTCE